MDLTGIWQSDISQPSHMIHVWIIIDHGNKIKIYMRWFNRSDYHVRHTKPNKIAQMEVEKLSDRLTIIDNNTLSFKGWEQHQNQTEILENLLFYRRNLGMFAPVVKAYVRTFQSSGFWLFILNPWMGE